MIDLEQARKIAEEYGKENMGCPITLTEFVDIIDGLYVFHYKTSIRGKHIGNPMYITIDKSGNVNRIYQGDILYKAMLIIRERNMHR